MDTVSAPGSKIFPPVQNEMLNIMRTIPAHLIFHSGPPFYGEQYSMTPVFVLILDGKCLGCRAVKNVFVGATIGRPLILQSKICRRKAKWRLFSCGKSENQRFSADEQCSPLHSNKKIRFFDRLFLRDSIQHSDLSTAPYAVTNAALKTAPPRMSVSQWTPERSRARTMKAVKQGITVQAMRRRAPGRSRRRSCI